MTKTVKWDITWRCNLRCKHCGAMPYLRKVKSREMLPTETVEEIFLDIKQNGFEEVNFLGGEPLLHKDFIQILKYLEEIDLDILFATNGTMLTRKVGYQLAQISTLTNISVSVYGGLKETHGMLVGKTNQSGAHEGLFNMSTIKKELHAGTRISLNLVLTKYLIQEGARPLAQLADRCDVDTIYPIMLGKQGNALVHWGNLKAGSTEIVSYIRNLIENLRILNRKRRISSKNEINLSLGTIPLRLSLEILDQYGPLSFFKVSKFDRRCPVIDNKNLYLTPDGYAYPCDPFFVFLKRIANELKREIEPLTVAKSPLREILESEYFNVLRDYFINLHLNDIREECRSCNLTHLCNECPLVLKYTETPTFCGEYYG